MSASPVPGMPAAGRMSRRLAGLVRIVSLVCLAFTAMALAPADIAHAQQIVALVNGEPITEFDIEQRSKLIRLSTRKSPSRKEVLEELINEKVKIREAKKFNLSVSSPEIETAYAGMGQRMNMSKDQMTQLLARSGIRPETLKQQIEAGIVWNQLLRGRFGKSLTVGEGDVRDVLASGQVKEDSESFEYRLLPVVLIVPRGSDRSLVAQRHGEAENLRKQISSCAEADRAFRALRYGAVRASVSKTSAELPDPLRDILNKLEIGRLTAPEVTAQGIQMFALCDRRATTGDSPAKRAAREKAFAEKFSKKSDSYLAEARRGMMIEYR